jgi:uridine kinase
MAVRKPVLIGIAGGSASGKKALAEKLFRELGTECSLVQVDSFYKNL